jgi:hypothetical protein
MADHDAPDPMEQTKSVDPEMEAQLRRFADELGGADAPEAAPDSGPEAMQQTAGVTPEMEAELRKFAMGMKSDDQLRAAPAEPPRTPARLSGSMEDARPMATRPSGRSGGGGAAGRKEDDLERTMSVNDATEAELRRFAMEMKAQFSAPAAATAGHVLSSMEQTKSVGDAEEAELRKFAMEMKTNFNEFAKRIQSVRGATGGQPRRDAPDLGEQTRSVDEATEAELRKFAMEMKGDFAAKSPGRTARPKDIMEETIDMDDARRRELEAMGDPFADLSEDDLPS